MAWQTPGSSPRHARNGWRVTALGAGLAALALVAAPSLPRDGSHASADPSGSRRAVTFSMRTMGTYANVTLVTDDSAAVAPIAHIAQSVLARVDSLMSNWTTTSEVARLNRECAAGPVHVHPEVARVIATALDVWRGSEGTFDITVEPLVRAWGFIGGPPHVPPDSVARAASRLVGAQQLRFDPVAGTLQFERPGVKIDLGGIAKGYAVDVAAESLRAHGVHDALVDLTGNMFALGHPPTAPGWRIGIRDPRDRLPYFARIQLSGEGISTSGKYEQFVAADGKTYGHIMDPRTGRPAEGLLSVTLITPSAFTCDSWDTPMFVLGAEKAKALARRHSDFGAVLVTPGSAGIDTAWVESSLKNRFTLEPAARSMFRVVYF